MDVLAELQLAEQYAGAWVLMALKAVERGYADLMAHDPLVAQGVEVAASEALARGVPEGEITTTAAVVLKVAQDLASAGVDPQVIAAQTKSEAAATDEADASNASPEEKEEMHVAANAHEPPPPGAIVDPPTHPAVDPASLDPVPPAAPPVASVTPASGTVPPPAG